MDLRDYEQEKFAIAEILRAASVDVPRDRDKWHERLRDLFIRLAEDRFNLVVVGRFNRGKTSIMNAIMGNDRLPVGIVPLTSVITTVCYGTKERVVLNYDRKLLTQDVPIESLRQYVTQEGNPGNALRIRMAEVQLRAEILRRGFYFVDTPGLGSAIAENTRTTQEFLPEADAFLVVTSYESPLSEEEMRFFQDVSSSAKRIFVAINKHDAVSEAQRNEVLAYVRNQLRGIFGEDTPQLFSVSARDGLEAKRSHNAARLDKSGLPALEEALVSFLLAEKSDQFLVQMCRRVAHLIRELPSSTSTNNLSIQINILADRTHRSVHVDSPGLQAEAPSLRQLQPCEICTHINDALWNFECKYQYELSTNRDEQSRFAERGGFCSFHTWQYRANASKYGISTALPTLLDHLVTQLRAPGDGNRERRSTLATEHCVFCGVRAKAEAEAISGVGSRLSEQGDRALNALSAICIPHLALLSDTIEDLDLVRKLLNHQAALLERLSEDMKRFTLKRDATRRHLETQEETTAADRAVLMVAGHRNVIGNRTYVASGRFISKVESAPDCRIVAAFPQLGSFHE
jgi:GTP-binding protein EngB required for normal cell division